MFAWTFLSTTKLYCQIIWTGQLTLLQAFTEENNLIITLQVILNFMCSQGFPYHNISHMVIFISPLKLSHFQQTWQELPLPLVTEWREVDLVRYQKFTTLKCMMKRGLIRFFLILVSKGEKYAMKGSRCSITFYKPWDTGI